ncbi:FUSC family protein [Pinirhizobacter sp.]|jgi:multidrug resistance protein MdtO|uniref:FUSC family protein n=1 Tax=Pinirhizobacter sp. TaxID=2950432 RepID=UPI002F3F9559
MPVDLYRSWADFLADELRVDRPRFWRMFRMTCCATAIATTFLVFRVPLPAYGAYVVLMASQRDVATSVTASLGALAAGVMAIGLGLVLYMVDIDEPALRLPAMAVVTFAAMYLSRLPKVGGLLFLAGFLLVITQTLIDQTPNEESLTHLMLWLLLIIASACTLVPLVELAFGRQPAQVFNDGLRERTRRLQAQLSGNDLPAITVPLGELATLAGRAGPTASRTLALVVELERVAAVKSSLPSTSAWSALSQAIDHFDKGHKSPGLGIPFPSGMGPDEALAYRQATRLVAGLFDPTPEAIAAGPVPRDPSAHIQAVRFAFKSSLAAMACYILYSAVDWPSIRTSVITCFFVALVSTGETVHKLSLRLAGALIGGTLAGLAIVFVFPLLDDIGGFVVLFMTGTLLCTWIATSSPLLAYAGLQMAFAFYLGVLQDAGPTDDLTVLRDRLAGIVLGNLAMSLVFLTLWPVSVVTAGRQILARIAGRLSRVLDGDGPVTSAQMLANATDMEAARRLSAMASFELARKRSDPSPLRADVVAMNETLAWSGAIAGEVNDVALRHHVAERLERIGILYDAADSTPPSADAAQEAGPSLPTPLRTALDTLEQEATGAS